MSAFHFILLWLGLGIVSALVEFFFYRRSGDITVGTLICLIAFVTTGPLFLLRRAQRLPGGRVITFLERSNLLNRVLIRTKKDD